MQSKKLHSEIYYLQQQLVLLNKELKEAIERDETLIHTKKIYQEVRILQTQIAELSKEYINNA